MFADNGSIPRLGRTETCREEGKWMGAPTGVSDVLSCLPVRPFARIRAAHVTSLRGQPAINNFPREADAAHVGETVTMGGKEAGEQKKDPDEAS